MMKKLCSQILKDTVWCTGQEEKLQDCPFYGRKEWIPSKCSHYEDAAVRCNAPKLQGHKVGQLSSNEQLIRISALVMLIE